MLTFSLLSSRSYDPVTCNGCTYENLCQAEAAGQTDCQMACAEPAADAMCTKEYAPVACGGSSWCIYDNLCLALASGKEEVDCVRSCPPVPEGVACTAGTFSKCQHVIASWSLCLSNEFSIQCSLV